jgi:protein-disulfide isomerase
MNNERNKQIMIWVAVAIVLAGAIFGMVKVVSKGLGAQPDAQTMQVEILPSVLAKEHEKGNPLARVTIIEYSDFECPACNAYHKAFAELVTSYGDKVRFIYRYFPLDQHPVGKLSAYAGEAAYRQGKFWEMHDMLFDHQADWEGKPGAARAMFIEYAKTLKLDIVKFTADLDAADVAKVVEDARQSGLKYGVDRTPSMYVNNTRVIDFSVLKKTIDDEIAKKL